jgi:hypothetical protein
MLVAALSLSGCASTAHQAGQASAPVAPDCGPPDKGATELLKPGALVLLGEIHGTAEVPLFVGRLACQATAKGLRVRVGLEIPQEEQARIDAFLSATDADAAKQSLLQGPFWTRDMQDGRSSEAMLALLTRLRDPPAVGTKQTNPLSGL